MVGQAAEVFSVNSNKITLLIFKFFLKKLYLAYYQKREREMSRELVCLRLQVLEVSLVLTELSMFPCPLALFMYWQAAISSLGLRVSWSVPSRGWSLSINGT